MIASNKNNNDGHHNNGLKGHSGLRTFLEPSHENINKIELLLRKHAMLLVID